ncbi:MULTISPECIES: hypothetical protein [Streptomyces]|nr:hypothetical protein [Streptomyces sp. JHD 1]MCX2971294.1 hypothetical protein [Streptomyces sp. JHD 1]
MPEGSYDNPQDVARRNELERKGYTSLLLPGPARRPVTAGTVIGRRRS